MIKKFDEFIKESSYGNDRFTSTSTEDFGVSEPKEALKLIRAIGEDNENETEKIMGEKKSVFIMNCTADFVEYLRGIVISENEENFYFVDSIGNTNEMQHILEENSDKNIVLSPEATSFMIGDRTGVSMLKDITDYTAVRGNLGLHLDKKIIILSENTYDGLRKLHIDPLLVRSYVFELE